MHWLIPPKAMLPVDVKLAKVSLIHKLREGVDMKIYR